MWVPSFKLFASDGTTPVYTFEYIIPGTNWPLDNPSSVEYTNPRASGSIIIPEGNKAYDIVLRGVLVSDNYTNLTTKIFALQNAIVANTRYVLTIDKSSSTHDTIKVMRRLPIEFDESLRTNIQKYTVILNALSWS
jgi:hypothetical protein